MRPTYRLIVPIMLACSVSLFNTSPVSAQSNAELLDETRRINARMAELEAKILKAEERALAAEAKAEAIEDKSDTPPNTTGLKGARLAFSGHLNRGLLFYDDGEEDDIRHVDNDNSSTRMRVIGDADITSELTVGTIFEVQFESNSSRDIQQTDTGSVLSSNSFTERKMEIYIDHQRFGRLWLGQGDSASIGTSLVDFSGTTVVGYSGLSDVGASLLFRDTNTGELSTIEMGDVLRNFDGLARDDRIRYDTPEYNGFKLSTSIADDDEKDLSLRYNTSLGGLKIGAAASYSDRTAGVDQYNGSFSVLHSQSGLSVTAATGSQSRTGSDPTFVYGKLGFQQQRFAFGKTAVSIDTYYAENTNVEGDESFAVGTQVVQGISSVGTEIFLGARLVDHETPGQDLDEVATILTGARVKF